MIKADVIRRIEELLAEGTVSRRAIAREIGVSRPIVNAVARGERRPRAPVARAARQEVEINLGPLARCAACGAKVYLPCVACQARDFARRQREPGRAREQRAGVSRLPGT